QCATRGLEVESKKASGTRRGADRAARRRAVKALLVMPGEDRLGHLAFDLDADLIGGHQVAAAPMIALGKRQHRWQCGGRRVGEQAVDAVFRDRELRVVVVVGVY